MLIKEIREAITLLMLDYPFYAHVLTELIIVPDNKVSIAQVELNVPIKMRLNPEAFKKFNIKHRAGILMHEILHLILEHFLRCENRDLKIFNIACDLAIHEIMPSKYILPEAITIDLLKKNWGYNLPSKQSAETYYNILIRNIEELVVINMNDLYQEVLIKTKYGDNIIYKQYGEYDYNSIIKDKNSSDLIKNYTQQIIDRAIKTCGNIPGEIERFINETQKVKTNWRRILSRFLQGRGKMIATSSYLRENKRYDNYPGRKKNVGMEALVAIDTSASISQKELSLVLSHLLKIKKISGTKIWIVWGDMCQQGGPILIENLTQKFKFKGGGGTDLCWPFRLADKMKINTVIYFTDGYGIVPEKVKQRTLWVLTPNGIPPTTKYGFVIKIEE